MKLSILDQIPTNNDSTSGMALHNASELGKLGDELGYERIWFAEHHNLPILSSSAPEMVAAYVLGQTKRIRVGTGGLMIMHYAPLKIAEQVNTLTLLSNGRFDFGIGRAPGGDPNSSRALAQNMMYPNSSLYEKIDLILKLSLNTKVNHQLYENIIVSPSLNNIKPEVHLLGSTGNSAIEAAQRGLGYSFAQFFQGALTKEIVDAYYNNFKPSAFMEKPYLSIAYKVSVGDNYEHAKYLANPGNLAFVLMQTGQKVIVHHPDEALKIINNLGEYELRLLKHIESLSIIGSIEEVVDQLKKEQAKYNFQEAMIITNPYHQDKRLETYKLLSKYLINNNNE